LPCAVRSRAFGRPVARQACSMRRSCVERRAPAFHPDQEGSESGRPVKTGGRASRLLDSQVA
jgi:hypothetical protein